jgi:hypothetical protein
MANAARGADGRIIPAAAVRAVDRFNPDGPRGYQAVPPYAEPGAPVRATRGEAMRDAGAVPRYFRVTFDYGAGTPSVSRALPALAVERLGCGCERVRARRTGTVSAFGYLEALTGCAVHAVEAVEVMPSAVPPELLADAVAELAGIVGAGYVVTADEHGRGVADDGTPYVSASIRRADTPRRTGARMAEVTLYAGRRTRPIVTDAVMPGATVADIRAADALARVLLANYPDAFATGRYSALALAGAR